MQDPSKELVTTALLSSINVPQCKEQNRFYLEQYGGIDRLLTSLRVSPDLGLSIDMILEMRKIYGANFFPETKIDGFYKIFFDALSGKSHYYTQSHYKN